MGSLLRLLTWLWIEKKEKKVNYTFASWLLCALKSFQKKKKKKNFLFIQQRLL